MRFTAPESARVSPTRSRVEKNTARACPSDEMVRSRVNEARRLASNYPRVRYVPKSTYRTTKKERKENNRWKGAENGKTKKGGEQKRTKEMHRS